MQVKYRGIMIETRPASGAGMCDVLIDNTPNILKSVKGEDKAIGNAKGLIDIFFEDNPNGC